MNKAKIMILAVAAILSLATHAVAMPRKTKCEFVGLDKAGKTYTAEIKINQDVSHLLDATLESLVLAATEELKGQGFDPAAGRNISIVCTNLAGEGYRIEAGEKVKTRSCNKD